MSSASAIAAKLKAFLDTSALFAGLFSDKGGARVILELGEAHSFRLLTSPEVMAELDAALRQKAPAVWADMALFLHRGNFEVAPSPAAATVARCHTLTRYLKDAQVLAAAWESGADYFVTLDKEHFLENTSLRQAVPFPVGTPGDFLNFFRDNWMLKAEERKP